MVLIVRLKHDIAAFSICKYSNKVLTLNHCNINYPIPENFNPNFERRFIFIFALHSQKEAQAFLAKTKALSHQTEKMKESEIVHLLSFSTLCL